jgi:hypothetical protein
LSFAAIFFSCKKTQNEQNDAPITPIVPVIDTIQLIVVDTINKQLLLGTWKPIPNQIDWRSRTFEKDSVYLVDGGNWGYQQFRNKWWWTGDTINFTWGGVYSGDWKLVKKLTNDSLVVLFGNKNRSSTSVPYRYFRQ